MCDLGHLRPGRVRRRKGDGQTIAGVGVMDGCNRIERVRRGIDEFTPLAREGARGDVPGERFPRVLIDYCNPSFVPTKKPLSSGCSYATLMKLSRLQINTGAALAQSPVSGCLAIRYMSTNLWFMRTRGNGRNFSSRSLSRLLGS